MKKTLLIAAAALAAGVISSQAQSVYSQNIVGYYNVTVPTNGFALVGSQLNLDGTNGISSVFTSGLVSDPNFVKNSELLIWNPNTQQYQTLYYLSSSDATSDGLGAGGFYDTGGNFYNTPVPPGSSVFLYNYANSSSNLTVTLVGTVPQTTNVYTIVPGYNLFSVAVPISSSLVGAGTNGVNFTGTSDPNFVSNDQLLQWNPTTQQYQTLYYLNAADATADGLGSAGFYDTGGNYYNVTPNVGVGFFINHVVNTTEYWTNSFQF